MVNVHDVYLPQRLPPGYCEWVRERQLLAPQLAVCSPQSWSNRGSLGSERPLEMTRPDRPASALSSVAAAACRPHSKDELSWEGLQPVAMRWETPPLMRGRDSISSLSIEWCTSSTRQQVQPGHS